MCADLAFAFFALESRVVRPDSELAWKIRAGMVHLICDAGGVLGFISFSAIADHLYVDTVAVLPTRRCKGIGSRLLAFVEAEAARLRLGSVKLLADGLACDNVLFFQRRDYRETGRCEEPGFSRVYFSKSMRRARRQEVVREL